MRQVDVTLGRTLKVYWSLAWRSAVWLLGPVVLLVALGYRAYAGNPAGPFNFEAPVEWGLLLACIVAIVIAAPILILRSVLRQAYSDFRIVLEGAPRPLKIEPRVDQTINTAIKRRPKGPLPDGIAARIEPTVTASPVPH